MPVLTGMCQRAEKSLEINAEDSIITYGKRLKSNLQGERLASAKNMDSSYCYRKDKISRDVGRWVMVDRVVNCFLNEKESLVFTKS